MLAGLGEAAVEDEIGEERLDLARGKNDGSLFTFDVKRAEHIEFGERGQTLAGHAVDLGGQLSHYLRFPSPPLRPSTSRRNP